MKRKRTVGGAEALFAAAFFYALTGIFVREVAPMWGDNAQVAARYSLVFIFLFAYGLFQKKSRVPKQKMPAAIALGVLFALVVLFFTASVERTTVANSLFTFYATNMVVSFLLGTLLLHEKISASKMAAIVLALTGLSVYADALIAGNLGLLYGVAAGVCDGTSNLFRKKLEGVNRNAVNRVQYFVGTIFTITVTLLSSQEIIRQASLRGTIMTLLFAAILITGSNLLLYGYQHFDVNIGTVIMSTELVFAAVLAYILFQETPATHELVGGCLIFGASIIGSGILEKRRGQDDRAIPAQPD